jgi:ElaA protein
MAANPMTELSFKIARLDELSGRELHAMLAQRERVFIVEQNCPYQDADEYDLVSWHLACHADGRIAAYLRIVDAGHKYTEASIGRVLSVKEYRGLGLGKQLMQEALKRFDVLYPDQGIRISAQSYLLEFYKDFGFKPVGGEYLEDGIPHTEMLRAFGAAG